VQDLRQEIYISVLEAAERSRPLSPRLFLFTCAKNLLIDRARRSRIVRIDLLQSFDGLDVLVDEASPERCTGGLQQLKRLVDAFEKLPERCREVVWMKKIDGLSQKEIASSLGIAEGTVEAHMVRGMRLLTGLFHGAEPAPRQGTGNTYSPQESQHEK
jgi:RNA polymerase sigma factor (sigma-70 family)